MNKKKKILLMLCLAVIMSITSCSKTPEQSIIGKWKVVSFSEDGEFEDYSSIWEFHNDGSLSCFDVFSDVLSIEYKGNYFFGANSNSNNIIVGLPDEVLDDMLKGLYPITGFITELTRNRLVLDLFTFGTSIHIEFERTNNRPQTIQESLWGTWKVIDCYLFDSQHTFEASIGDLYEFNSTERVVHQHDGETREGTYSVNWQGLELNYGNDNKIRWIITDINSNSTKLFVEERITQVMGQNIALYYVLEKISH